MLWFTFILGFKFSFSLFLVMYDNEYQTEKNKN